MVTSIIFFRSVMNEEWIKVPILKNTYRVSNKRQIFGIFAFYIPFKEIQRREIAMAGARISNFFQSFFTLFSMIYPGMNIIFVRHEDNIYFVNIMLYPVLSSWPQQQWSTCYEFFLSQTRKQNCNIVFCCGLTCIRKIQ